MDKGIQLFLWGTPNSAKITIALEEMGLAYQAIPVAIGKGEQFAPDFLKLSPNNKIPAILDPDGPDGIPLSLFESGAILAYLGRKSDRFFPADERARAEVEQWLYWQMAGIGPAYGQASHFLFYAPQLTDDPARLAYGAERFRREIDRLLGVLDRALAGRDYVAVQYSIADMAIYPWVAQSEKLGHDLEAFPHARAWLARVGRRDAVKRGMAVIARWSLPPPSPGSEEHRVFSASLFGQTAASVAAAATHAAKSPRGSA